MLGICQTVAVHDRKLLDLKVKIFQIVQRCLSLSELIYGCSSAISKLLLYARFLSASQRDLGLLIPLSYIALEKQR